MIKKGIIYKHTFPNGKCYIGKTEQSLEKRIGKDGIGGNTRYGTLNDCPSAGTSERKRV